MKLSKLGMAVSSLMVSVLADSTGGLMYDHDVVEQLLFELFIRKGYNTAEARMLAIHVVEALEVDD